MAAFLDEAHNAELSAAYAVALSLRTLFIIGDDAQYIEQLRYGNKLAAEAVNDDEEGFNWEKAITGGVWFPVWAALPHGLVLRLNVTWRFGPESCRFLRQTVLAYGEKGVNIRSPLEDAGNYKAKELLHVPETFQRFVFYKKMNYYTTTARGFLDPTPRLLADRDAGEARVGACLTIFQNVVHEAL